MPGSFLPIQTGQLSAAKVSLPRADYLPRLPNSASAQSGQQKTNSSSVSKYACQRSPSSGNQSRLHSAHWGIRPTCSALTAGF